MQSFDDIIYTKQDGVATVSIIVRPQAFRPRTIDEMMEAFMMPGTTIVSAWWSSRASRAILVPEAIRKFVARAGIRTKRTPRRPAGAQLAPHDARDPEARDRAKSMAMPSVAGMSCMCSVI